MLNFDIRGFDKIQKELKNLQNNIKKLKGPRSLSFNELFPLAFIKKYTNFDSLDDMFKKSGFTVNSMEDFEKIPDKEWDIFIEKNTRFKNWQEMLDVAVKEWTTKKLGF